MKDLLDLANKDVTHLMKVIDSLQADLAAVRAGAISLRCHCTADFPIRVDSIPHGLLAGWKCGVCGETLMLSELARVTEGWESGEDWHSPKYKLLHPEQFADNADQWLADLTAARSPIDRHQFCEDCGQDTGGVTDHNCAGRR